MLDTIIIFLFKLKFKTMLKRDGILAVKSSYYKLADRIDLTMQDIKDSYKIEIL